MNLSPYLTVFAPLPAFGLALFRVGGMFLAAPLFAGGGVPARIRGAMAVLLAITMTPLVAAQTPRATEFPLLLVGGRRYRRRGTT